MRGSPVLSVLAVLALLAPAAPSRDLPEQLEGLVFGDERRVPVAVTLDGLAFDTLTRVGTLPFLLWRAEEDTPPPFGADPEEVSAWLLRCRGALAHRDFEPVYADRFTWDGRDIWTFDLVRRGVPWYEARVLVIWDGDRFLGLVNDIPGRIGQIEEPGAPAGGDEQVYFSRRIGPGRYDLDLATLQTEVRAASSIVRVTTPEAGVVLTQYMPNHPSLGARQFARFEEYPIPTGSFPDQIGIDSNDQIWFSQPNDNLLTVFDPVAETFTHHMTMGGSGPDGLYVDSQDRVFTGLYFSGQLGWLEIQTGTFQVKSLPYGGSFPAIPVESSLGTIWVTDHIANRISEFDPVTGNWVQSLVVPTPSSWVVEGIEDLTSHVLYFTAYSADNLVVKDVNGPGLSEVATAPGGGPAFPTYWKDKIYWTEWLRNRMGEYDIATGAQTYYTFPVANEWGGPIGRSPLGNIVVGTRNVGYIMVFHVASQAFTHYKIPTAGSALKDGLVVASNGTIWFTESGKDKIAKLTR